MNNVNIEVDYEAMSEELYASGLSNGSTYFLFQQVQHLLELGYTDEEGAVSILRSGGVDNLDIVKFIHLMRKAQHV